MGAIAGTARSHGSSAMFLFDYICDAAGDGGAGSRRMSQISSSSAGMPSAEV